jgi:hypothetical protein
LQAGRVVSGQRATVLELIDAVEVPTDIHPSGRQVVREALERARQAAAVGDFAEVNRELTYARWQIDQEREWNEENKQTARGGAS